MTLPVINDTISDDITLFENRNEIINSDTIFGKWEKYNSYVYQVISNNCSDSIKNILYRDTKCRTECLSHHDYNLKQICEGCNYIRFLLLYPVIENNSFQIYHGQKKGKILKYNSYDYVNEIYTKNKYVKNLSNNITKLAYTYLKNENYKLDNIYYYTVTNKYYNKFCISLLVKEIMKNKNFSLSPSFIWAYSCNKKIHLVTYKADYSIHLLKNNYNFIQNASPISKKRNTNQSFTKQSVNNIINQIILQCHFLSNYYFIHNEASIKYINFYIQTVNFEYNKFYIQSPFKSVIEISPYSSISIYNKSKDVWIRLSHSNFKATNLNFPIESVRPKYFIGQYYKNKLSIPYTSDYLKNRVLCYKIGTQLSNFNKVRRLGIPVFKSYDFICFMVSLLLEKEFYNTFINTEYFNIWKNIWLDDEFDSLMKDIKENKKENNYETVSLIISKYFVMIDALNYFFNLRCY